LFSIACPNQYHNAANIDDELCDVIGCYAYDVNSAAAAAQGAKDKDESVLVVYYALHEHCCCNTDTMTSAWHCAYEKVLVTQSRNNSCSVPLLNSWLANQDRMKYTEFSELLWHCWLSNAKSIWSVKNLLQ